MGGKAMEQELELQTADDAVAVSAHTTDRGYWRCRVAWRRNLGTNWETSDYEGLTSGELADVISSAVVARLEGLNDPG